MSRGGDVIGGEKMIIGWQFMKDSKAEMRLLLLLASLNRGF